MDLKMKRPDWDEFLEDKKGFGYVACPCGAMLSNQQMLRKHWQDGHFDEPA